MKLTQFAVDDGPHNSDGLLLHGWDGDQQVTGFISRRVMDDWVDPRQPYRGRKSLYREQYNALGKCNLAAIERIVTSKYQRGPTFNRQYPFVDVLLSDITKSGEVLDARELVRSAKTDVAWGMWPRRSLMLRLARSTKRQNICIDYASQRDGWRADPLCRPLSINRTDDHEKSLYSSCSA
jgi:hypothetical protein